MDDDPGNPSLVPTFVDIVTSPPSIGASDAEDLTAVQSKTARNHRGGLTGHLVACIRVEYLSCATATRSRFYLSTPVWW